MNPLLYEVNARCWLRGLSDRGGTAINLLNVPETELREWKRLGFTHIWLMGAWSTGSAARAEALKVGDLRRAYDQALPGWNDRDVAGSPYAVAAYDVPAALGGEAGLARFRKQLNEHGMKLVLDFVPNHVGLDHPWAAERPELFVQSQHQVAGTFAQHAGGRTRWLAHGKDPYFAPWTDTAQLDYRRATTRAAMTELLVSIASRCDCVRCDMAMLVLNEVFARTWESFPVAALPPVGEFWASAIKTVKAAHPRFMFLAEAYWSMEGQLQNLGFDYTYDKTLYDGLVHRDAAGVHHHVTGLPFPQVAAGAHFLENHDEPRIAASLPLPEHKAAALVILGLPGLRFLHEGQLTGARLKLPVQLCRRASEPGQPEIQQLYELLLTTLPRTAIGTGKSHICRPRAAWADNPTAVNFVVVQWQLQPPEFDLVVVNLARHRSQCYAPLAADRLPEHNWLMKDLLSQEWYKRSGEDLQNQGLYLDLPAHGAQLFHFQPTR